MGRAVGVARWPSFLMGHDNPWLSRAREPGGENPVITDWQHLLRWTPFVSLALAPNCQGARNEVPTPAPTGPFVSARLRLFPRLFKLPSAKLFTPCLAAARITTSVPESHLSSIHIVWLFFFSLSLCWMERKEEAPLVASHGAFKKPASRCSGLAD